MVGVRRREMPCPSTFSSFAEQSFEAPLVSFDLSHTVVHKRERFVAP
jgi:hypothetical protein